MLILALIGFLTYFNALENQFVWDDDHFIVQNILVRAFDVKKIFSSNTVAGAGVTSDYYRPLTSLTFGADLMLWGLNPFGFHLTNILLHIATGLMLFLFLTKLGLSTVFGFWVSLIFLVHPVQVESVTYISSRGNILYSLLSLLSLYLFLASCSQGKVRKIFSLFFSVIFFALSILGKEVGLGTSIIYALLLFWQKYHGNLNLSGFHGRFRSQIVACLLIFWIALLYVVLRIGVLNFSNVLNFTGVENIYTQNIMVRIYTFLKIIWLYAGLVFVPHPLYMERSTDIVTKFWSSPVIAGVILIISVLGCGVIEAWKHGKLWILFGSIWVIAHIAPVSGLVPMTYLYHENWLYMPIVGLLIILYGVFQIFLKKSRILRPKAVILCLIVTPAVLAGLTVLQNQTWKNKIIFFEHNLQYANTARLHLNLGHAYIGEGRLEQAKSHLKQAVAIADWYPQTHYNLGVIYQRQKKFKLAEKEYLESVSLDYNYLYSYPLLIDLYIETGQHKKALPFVQRLLDIYPGDSYLTSLRRKLISEPKK